MKTDYRIDDFQQTYFVIDSYEQLFDATVKTDFAPIYDRMQGKFALKPEDVVADDDVITRGSQAYAKAGERLAPVDGGK
jgi:phenylalanine-4-hydroxylase